MPTEKFQFTGEGGHQLAAALDLPDGEPVGLRAVRALLHLRQGRAGGQAHRHGTQREGHRHTAFRFHRAWFQRGRFRQCDVLIQRRRSRPRRRSPAQRPQSTGDPDWPQPGGAAILAAAGRIPEANAVVTIAAPSDPAHVTGLFKDHVDRIREQGKAEVSLAGRPFTIKREFLDDVAEQRLLDQVKQLHKALLVMQSPTDDTVGIDNATRIFVAAKHPKSFISLSGADHLLSQRRDSSYVADVIAAWATRYVDLAAVPAAEAQDKPRQVVVQETRNGKFQNAVAIGPHHLLADEPRAAGGDDSGPGPYDFLLTALGACKSMTMRLYADRKSFPLERATVTLNHAKIYARIARNAKRRRACSTRSRLRSVSKARSMPSSASASSKSLTNVRCIGH